MIPTNLDLSALAGLKSHPSFSKLNSVISEAVKYIQLKTNTICAVRNFLLDHIDYPHHIQYLPVLLYVLNVFLSTIRLTSLTILIPI